MTDGKKAPAQSCSSYSVSCPYCLSEMPTVMIWGIPGCHPNLPNPRNETNLRMQFITRNFIYYSLAVFRIQFILYQLVFAGFRYTILVPLTFSSETFFAHQSGIGSFQRINFSSWGWHSMKSKRHQYFALCGGPPSRMNLQKFPLNNQESAGMMNQCWEPRRSSFECQEKCTVNMWIKE